MKYKRFRKCNELPRDIRTLLHTPRDIVTISKCGGQYLYIGIEKGLNQTFSRAVLNSLNGLELTINIDGLLLEKSSNRKLWPILGCFNDSTKVFIIGLFCGYSKPDSNTDRQPRGLNDLPYWKATELRQFLLYHCPIVLKSIVSKNIYEHFMSLHFAMSILLNNKLIMVESMLDYPENVIVWFVSSSSVVFGEIFPTYNVHSLLHVVNDVRNFNTSLNNLSAFKFENHMQKLKRSVKNSNNPVVQIYKREFEIQQNSTKAEKNDVSRKVINVKQKNKCFNLKNKDICLVERVIEDGERYLVTVISKHYLIDLYCFPTKSSNIGITYIENLERVKKNRLLLKKTILMLKMYVCLTRLVLRFSQ